MAHNKSYKYQAFISYAHADEALAARLHRALETYPIPKYLTLKDGTTGPKKLSPIFRDTAELTAHHSLSEKIREAVQSSRVLIILCSPSAKISHWVNEEIRLFRTIHGEGSILCVLAEGTPETSFPPALTEDGREPLAANLGSNKESFNLGVTQLAASMLGVGLDQLIQRDAKRRRNRFRLLTTASLSFAAIMGGMALTAINARNAAEVSRTAAETMTEFMLTDLKQDLEPLGKLNVLDDVGKRVTDYYSAIPLSDMDDDRLARQARARHLLGQVAIDQGHMEKAQMEIEAAYAATQEVLQRNPENTDAIFAHAQSAYWVGTIFHKIGNLEKMEGPIFEYNNLAQRLYASDPKNFDWVMEAAWGQNNLGIWARTHATKSKTQDSIDYYSQAIIYFREALVINPKSKSAQYELSNTLVGRATAELAYGTAKQSRAFKLEQLEHINQLTQKYPDDKSLYLQKLISELDYHLDFFLRLTKTQDIEVRDLLKQLYELVLYDPENLTYKVLYLNYTLEYISKIHTPIPFDLSSDISNIVSQLPNEQSAKEYFSALLEFIQFNQDDIIKSNRFHEVITDKKFENSSLPPKWTGLYLLFFRYQDSDIAREFLHSVNSQIKSPYPTTLDKKIKAHAELNECSEVSPLIKDLKLRGFDTNLYKNTLLKC